MVQLTFVACRNEAKKTAISGGSLSNLFSKEAHFLWTASILIGAHVLLMHFFLPTSWVDSNSAIMIVDTMKQIVPAIRRLHDRGAGNTDFWCFFFSLFWATAPIYWLLGFLGGARLSRDRYEKVVIETSTPHLIFLVFLFSFGVVSEFNFPITDGMFIFHLTNDFFPVRLLSWWLMVVIVYYQALATRALIIKMVG